MATEILIIEDEEDIRDFAARVLELEGYRVLQAVNGSEGLRMLRQYPVSLVLLDLRLPDCDGWALLTELKGDPHLSRVPVVMFTASAAESRRSQALAIGAIDYLVKPLSAARLKETVHNVLTRERKL
ncbi:MAG TPA: response regulator [Dehalococcoidia bacterium]|nr:response regulator [Dehalococcoidia bacterium]